MDLNVQCACVCAAFMRKILLVIVVEYEAIM